MKGEQMRKNYEMAQFMEKVNTGIAVIKVDETTLEFNLLYANSLAIEILKCSEVNDTCVFSLINIIKSSEENISLVLHNLRQTGYKKGECVINNFEGVPLLIKYRLLILRDDSETYIQITLMRDIEMIEMERRIDIVRSLDTWDYKGEILCILFLQNGDEIVRKNGTKKYYRIMEIILNEVKKTNKVEQQGENIKDDVIIFALERNSEDVENRIKNLLENIKREIFQNGFNLICEIKIGISSNTEEKYVAFHEAKFCLQKIINSSKNYLLYRKPHEKQFLKFVIQSDLPYAMENDELDVYFQAIFDIEAEKTYGFEALVRWNHTKYGEIGPADFIPLAEETELITKIDLWVAKSAIDKFREEIYVKNPNLKLNINVSPRDFFDETFVEQFLNIIRKGRIPCSNIILELTETLNLYPKRASLMRLKNEGVMIALDDFGTGFASLSQIKNYQIDILKIDISFIRDINKEYNNTLITSAILSMASDLNISVIAEGVDSSEQIEFLKSRHCSYIQGYRFHKPDKIESIELDVFSEKYKNEFRNYRVIKRDDYVKEYMYGKYIFIQLNSKREVIVPNGRINEISDLRLDQGDLFDLILEADMREEFEKRFVELFSQKVELAMISYTRKKGKIIPITMIMTKNTEKGS